MQFLPSPEEQAWLRQAVAGLVARRGASPFLDAVLVEPSRRFFPDPWQFSHRGLDRLVRRLMQYAGMHDLDIRVDTYVEDGEDATQAAGLFLGLDDGRALFGFNEGAPVDDEYMAGVMAHEVAHAYRAFHGLMGTAPRQEEEWLTDTTAVYLGFGIFVANNSFRHRADSVLVGGLTWRESSTHHVGYLTPQAFAYLLAMQFVARDYQSGEVRRLAKFLEPNQASFVTKTFDVLNEQRTELLAELRLPAETAAAPPPALDTILRPLPPYVGLPDPQTVSPERVQDEPKVNSGRPVFRVRENLTSVYGGRGVFLGLLAGIVLAFAVAPKLGPEAAFLALFAGATAGGIVGGVWGARHTHDECSDPTCEAVLEPSAVECPACGGVIAGRIARRAQRLEAEEAYEQSQRGRPKPHKVPRARRDLKRS